MSVKISTGKVKSAYRGGVVIGGQIVVKMVKYTT